MIRPRDDLEGVTSSMRNSLSEELPSSSVTAVLISLFSSTGEVTGVDDKFDGDSDSARDPQIDLEI